MSPFYLLSLQNIKNHKVLDTQGLDRYSTFTLEHLKTVHLIKILGTEWGLQFYQVVISLIVQKLIFFN